MLNLFESQALRLSLKISRPPVCVVLVTKNLEGTRSVRFETPQKQIRMSCPLGVLHKHEGTERVNVYKLGHASFADRGIRDLNPCL